MIFKSVTNNFNKEIINTHFVEFDYDKGLNPDSVIEERLSSSDRSLSEDTPKDALNNFRKKMESFKQKRHSVAPPKSLKVVRNRKSELIDFGILILTSTYS